MTTKTPNALTRTAYCDFGGICREYLVTTVTTAAAVRRARELMRRELRLTTAQATFISVAF